jgi:hypothetical protein
VTNGDVIDYHHLVRDGITIDCVGTGWRIDRLCDENPEFDVEGAPA